LVKQKKEITPEERTVEPKKRAGRKDNTKKKLGVAAEAQERVDALAFPT
jgi:hypothetical protein